MDVFRPRWNLTVRQIVAFDWSSPRRETWVHQAQPTSGIDYSSVANGSTGPKAPVRSSTRPPNKSSVTPPKPVWPRPRPPPAPPKRLFPSGGAPRRPSVPDCCKRSRTSCANGKVIWFRSSSVKPVPPPWSARACKCPWPSNDSSATPSPPHGASTSRCRRRPCKPHRWPPEVSSAAWSIVSPWASSPASRRTTSPS